MLKTLLRGAFLSLAFAPLTALADGEDGVENFAVHGQATATEQWHPAYGARFSGAESLDPRSQRNETTDVTLFIGYRPWSGAELWANPEIDQGFGLSNTLGVAGFVSGEAYKVGKHRPYFRLPRAFIRQEIDLDGDASLPVDAAANQLADRESVDRVVIWAGKFAVTDLFDTNSYANDARSQFLNWALVNQGSFDYAADAWGFTYGGAAEWYQDRWTLRAGLFDLSVIPNNTALDPKPLDQYQIVGEIEERHSLLGQPGKMKATWWQLTGRMGGYDQAVAFAASTGQAPLTGLVRSMRDRQGAGLNGEQQLAEGLGLFARLGWNQGKYEAYEFTDINKSASAGISLSGSHWNRDDDVIGAAIAVNGISRAAKHYFAAGGLGVLVGDGALVDAAAEQIFETYYNYSVMTGITLSIDYQLVNHPAYNVDRGPVNVFAARLHAAF